MTKRLFFSLISLLVFSSSVFADTCTHKLSLKMVSGKSEYYILSEKPIVTFDGDSLFIAVESVQMTSYPRNIISNVTFDKIESQESSDDISDRISISDTIIINKPDEHKADAIKQVNSNNNDFEFRYIDSDNIQIHGINGRISIYSINGMVVSTFSADINSNINISLSDLPAGIYIIRTDKRSIKIQKK